MLIIRKQNFANEPCFFCRGNKVFVNDPQYAVQYQLYHKLPVETHYLSAKVIIPRCKCCANKIKPVRLISLIIAVLGVMSGFLYTIGSHVFVISLICGFIWGGITYIVVWLFLDFVFRIVYNQIGGDYQIVKVLKQKYGWQMNKPSKGSSDLSFTYHIEEKMFHQLREDYGCDIGNI